MNRDLVVERGTIRLKCNENTFQARTVVPASSKAVNDNGYTYLLNRRIKELFTTAFRITVKNPSLACFTIKTIGWQSEAATRRLGLEKRGIHVPPLMILSVTSRCNLHCKGCYTRAGHPHPAAEMDSIRLRGLIKEAEGLGTSVILLAGGEPLTRPEILDITRDFPKIIFPLFTNGLLLDDKILAEIKKQKNVIPVVSLEGDSESTDFRRGDGVYNGVQKAIREMRSRKIFFGTSIMMTRGNIESVTDYHFVSELIASGCRLFFFVEYVAVGEGKADWVLTDDQRKKLRVRMASLRDKFPAIFINFPGDEEEFGGCLSAGRGFIHINSEGGLEPCPAAPYSDSSVRDKPLVEALKSDLLRQIRENREALRETSGGCALWEKREWVKTLLA